MGIDGLDIAFRLEKEFNIPIRRGEVWFVFTTPGKIHDYIWQRLQGIHPPIPCSIEKLHEQVLAALLKLPGIRKSWLRPTFERMIPQPDRLEIWNRFSELLQVPLPPLESLPSKSFLRFPKDCKSPGHLVFWIWKHHRDRFLNEREEFRGPAPEGADRWTRESSWQAVREVIVDCLGVELNEVTRDARMVEDLGVD